MRQITTHNIPQDAKSQTHVRAQTEVRSQCKQAQKALVDTTKALANLTKETTPGRTYTTHFKQALSKLHEMTAKYNMEVPPHDVIAAVVSVDNSVVDPCLSAYS